MQIAWVKYSRTNRYHSILRKIRMAFKKLKRRQWASIGWGVKRFNLYCNKRHSANSLSFQKRTFMNKTHENWIYLQCAKWGRVTFGKESLKAILTATDRNLLRQLKTYCSKRKLKMQMDSTKSLFTFQIRGNPLKLACWNSTASGLKAYCFIIEFYPCSSVVRHFDSVHFGHSV